MVTARQTVIQDLTLLRLMDPEAVKTKSLIGVRKDAMWLLRNLTRIKVKPIADLFWLAESTVADYISETRFRSAQLLELAQPAYTVARLDLP